MADAGLFAPILLVSRVSLSLRRQQPQKTFPTCTHALRNLISATAAVPDTAAPLASRADSSTARTAARATAAPHEGCRNYNGAGESQGGTGETHGVGNTRNCSDSVGTMLDCCCCAGPYRLVNLRMSAEGSATRINQQHDNRAPLSRIAACGGATC